MEVVHSQPTHLEVTSHQSDRIILHWGHHLHRCLGSFGHVARLDRDVLARDASCLLMLAVPRYALRRAGEDHSDVRGRLGCIRLVMALQPPSAKMQCSHTWTFPANNIGTKDPALMMMPIITVHTCLRQT